jgi:TolB-like protein
MALRAVIDHCLKKEAGERYQRAGEVRAALEAVETGTVAPWASLRYLIGRRSWQVAAVALVVATITGVVGLDFGRSNTIESLVVLPFSNLSGDPAQEFMADGMTEALIAELSKLEGLSVVSRTSAMQYKGANKPLREIVDELGVDGVIEGGFLREDELVRATISLIDGQTGKSLWAQSFERESTGILALHSEMVRAIADGIQPYLRRPFWLH